MSSSSRQKLSACDKFQNSLLSLDIYRKDFNFLLPDKQTRYRTLFGSLLSIFTLVTMLTYFSMKLNVLLKRDDYGVQILEQENFFELSDHFGA